MLDGGAFNNSVLDEFIIKSNGNTLVQATKTSAFMGDGTKIIGDDNYFDFSHFQKGFTEVFDNNVVGSSHNDVIMAEQGSVYLAGGDGDDHVGLLSPWSGYHEDPAVLVGGKGADIFHIAVSEWMPEIEIADFDASEGDTIELNPSHALHDGFTGFKIVEGGLSLLFSSAGGGDSSVFVEVANNGNPLPAKSIFIDDTTKGLGVYELIGDYLWLGGNVVNPNEIVYGSQANDLITGGTKDQFFYTLSGHDFISGGGGLDTIVLKGLAKDASFSLVGKFA